MAKKKNVEIQEDQMIRVKGAREHNLKNVDLNIPKNKLVVFTGVSGSGKSSMAFDTLFAEGQRRYVESLSAYARQFLGQMEKPIYESIKGLAPTISIEQKTSSKNPRSTVGTITEIYDYLRVLYARIGIQFCHQCGAKIQSQTITEMLQQLQAIPLGRKFMLLSPLIQNRKGEYKSELDDYRQKGFARIRINGEVKSLDEELEINPKKKNNIELVIDRLVSKENQIERITDSVETALKWGDGKMILAILADGSSPAEERILSQKQSCHTCQISFPDLSPQSFSFNNPLGACPDCKGLGTALEMDPNKIVPEPELSIMDGALHPLRPSYNNPIAAWHLKTLKEIAPEIGLNLTTPFEDLDDKIKKAILYGLEKPIKIKNKKGESIDLEWEGIIPFWLRKWKETESEEMRNKYAEYLSDAPCHTCKGRRLRAESLAVKVGDLSLAELNEINIEKVYQHLDHLNLQGGQKIIADELLKEILHRLSFLKNVGLNYLSLNRPGPSLSGGESQRIRLASQLGSELTGVLYILDEPSIGLHPRDNRRLINTLCHLRDVGNSVIVVEHDQEMMEMADWVIDFGLGAGRLGGEVIAQGTYQELKKHPKSLTAAYLDGRRSIEIHPRRPSNPKKQLKIIGANANNLKNLSVSFPVGLFTCVTGVSGAGKSTLIGQILEPAAAHVLNGAHISRDIPCEKIEGFEYFDKVVNIDQSPIGRTPRSNPATYTKAWDEIREIFAQLPESKTYGFKAGRFSFNIPGGRCEACSGNGVVKVEMHFLADVYIPCDTCQGQRFNDATLRVNYKGFNIAQILNTPIDEVLKLFDSYPKLKAILQTLESVGVGYLNLGQSSTTLSGGEAQRIKLSRELSKRATGKTLYILDEPSTGLHFEDVKKLLEVIQKLVDAGNTVIMIEHHLDVIKTADYIIDLGPEGGEGGGKIMALGTPEEVALVKESDTGRFLKEILRKN